jgi:hypothetical protein
VYAFYRPELKIVYIFPPFLNHINWQKVILPAIDRKAENGGKAIVFHNRWRKNSAAGQA